MTFPHAGPNEPSAPRRLDRETGVVVVTTPGAYEVGHTLHVVGAPGRPYGCDWPDWVRRILMPEQNGNGGHAWGVGLDTAEAEQALQQRLGLLHPSLVKEPRAT